MIEESKQKEIRKRDRKEKQKERTQQQKFKVFNQVREEKSESSLSEDPNDFFASTYNQQNQSNNNQYDNHSQHDTYQNDIEMQPSHHNKGFDTYYPLKPSYPKDHENNLLLQREKELNDIPLIESPLSHDKAEKTTVLVKTNCIIFCDIPSYWKTKEDIKRSFNNVPLNFIRILPEHKCCLLSFQKHNDALKFKVKPPENRIGTCWGKENWMRNYFMNYDGVVEIKKYDIPRFITVFPDGSYEYID